MPAILTFPRSFAPALPLEGCWPCADFSFIFNATHPALWQKRADVEHDETQLQPIPYVVLRNAQNQLWCYARQGGDTRIDGRYSCGVGGHVEPIDHAPSAEETLHHTARRELKEELGLNTEEIPTLTPLALIYEGHSAIGRVHIGILFTAFWPKTTDPTPPAHEALHGLGFYDPAHIINEPRFELWSRLSATYLQSHPQ